MDSAIFFGKIHVIEWLRADDAKTGWELFEEVEPMGLMAKPNVDVSFDRVTTRDQFVLKLRSIRQDFTVTSKLPLIHIETHGLAEQGRPVGIGLSASGAVLWQELMEELIPLNELTGLRLFVNLAACEGMWGIQILQPTNRAAAVAIMGPKETISAGNLARASLAFYRSVFRGGSGTAAFHAMNAAINPNEPSFGIVNAEMAFKWVFRGYLRERCSPRATAERVARINRDFGIRRALEGHKRMAWEIERDRLAIQRHVQDHEGAFQEFRRRYFFIDVYPENDSRFPITLNDCLSSDP